MQNNLFKSLLFILIFPPQLAIASQNFYNEHPILYISPQFGIETSANDIQFMQNQSPKMFAKVPFPTTVFFNVNCCDTFGIEFGYTLPKKKSQDLVLQSGEIRPGGTEVVVAPKEYFSTVSQSKSYIGLKYDFHLNNHQPYLFGMIGITQIKTTASWERAMTPPDQVIASRRNFDFKKVVPFVKVGAYIPLPNSEHFSVRLAATWFRTSKLNNSTDGYDIVTPGKHDVATIIAKNAVHFSLGLTYNI